MFRIESYMKNLVSSLQQNFGQRLLYVGLQGSYLRGEADSNSDIDVMVILDSLSITDMETYKVIIDEIGNAEKSCGFISGKDEITNWNPCEICQLLHTTKDFYGKLVTLLPNYTTEDERTYIKLCLGNLYHEICHRYIHTTKERNIAKLPDTYKNVFFILQNVHYHHTGIFVQTKNELLAQLSEKNRAVLLMSIELKNRSDYKFDKAFSILFDWCKETLRTI